jgi:hypothetical protein|tara:strand:+ start:550 stop:1215 length:666 start_codon:yes stop_codon:yes gene_type:complete
MRANNINEPTMRDATEHEVNVLNHCGSEGSMPWIDQGRRGTIDKHKRLTRRRINEAIIIAARVKQMDPTGFLEACGARAMGLTLTGLPEPNQAAGVTGAIAYLLNHLEPAEASSLASGTDVTDNAITRADNDAILYGATTHLGFLDDKVEEWENSYDYAAWKYKDRYLTLPERLKSGMVNADAQKVENGFNIENEIMTLEESKAILNTGPPDHPSSYNHLY